MVFIIGYLVGFGVVGFIINLIVGATRADIPKLKARRH